MDKIQIDRAITIALSMAKLRIGPEFSRVAVDLATAIGSSDELDPSTEHVEIVLRVLSRIGPNGSIGAPSEELISLFQEKILK